MYGRTRSVRQRYLEVCVCFERLRRPICGVFSFQERSASSPSPTTQTATSDRKKLNCGHPAPAGIVHVALNEGLATPPRHFRLRLQLKVSARHPVADARALGDRAPPIISSSRRTDRVRSSCGVYSTIGRSSGRGHLSPADHNHRRRLGVVI